LRGKKFLYEKGENREGEGSVLETAKEVTKRSRRSGTLQELNSIGPRKETGEKTGKLAIKEGGGSHGSNRSLTLKKETVTKHK